MNKLLSYAVVSLKGFLMGIAGIIPGVSSGTVAVIVKIYDKIILNVDLVIKSRFRNFTALGFLLLVYGGNFAALFTLAGTMENLLELYPTLMRVFFMGLIVGSLPIIILKTTESAEKKFTLGTVIAFSASLAFIIGLNIVTATDIEAAPITTLTFGNSFIIFFTGLIASATAIIPGVSGSMMQLAIGMYPTFVNALSTINIPILIVLIAGMFFGLIAAARLIGFLLRNYYQITYFTIIGLLVGSIYQIWPTRLDVDLPSALSIIIVFILGFSLAFGSHVFDRYKKKSQ
jgi:putative membrane protein